MEKAHWSKLPKVNPTAGLKMLRKFLNGYFVELPKDENIFTKSNLANGIIVWVYPQIVSMTPTINQ